MSDWSETVEGQTFIRDVLETLYPKMSQTSVVMSLAPTSGNYVDVKFWVETGAAICLDKPIILVAAPGQNIPPKLEKVADHIVYADLRTEEGQQKIALALREASHLFIDKTRTVDDGRNE